MHYLSIRVFFVIRNLSGTNPRVLNIFEYIEYKQIVILTAYYVIEKDELFPFFSYLHLLALQTSIRILL